MTENNLKEYLEKLLSFSNIKKSEGYAQSLAGSFDSVESLFQTDRFSLSAILDGDADAAAYIRLVAALTSRRISDRFKNGKKYSQNAIKDYIVGLLCTTDVETVFVLLFDRLGRLISTDTLSDGTVNASGFLPRKLLDIAIRGGAKSVILAHNHPRGNTNPSRSDVSSTLVAKSVLENAGIALTNHYIVAGLNIEDCLLVTMGEAADIEKYSHASLLAANTGETED